MSKIKKLLGQRIKEIRLSKNLTQENLAELTDIGPTSISKIETGHTHPTPESLDKIANALQVPPYKLYQFNHLGNPDEIRALLLEMINNADNDELKLAYRILSGVFD